MIEINSIYADKRDAQNFVAECETGFNESLSRIAAAVLSEKGGRYLTLAGPTCSGKTTTAEKLTALLETGGRRARVISIDDFYYEKAEMDKMGIDDLEGPDSINIPLFEKCVSDLSAGRTARLPTFDFSTRKRICLTEYIPREDDIYIFEGIQAMYPSVTGVIKPYGFRSIFISVADDASVKGTVFDKNDIRLMRRTVRDFYHRSAAVELTMKLWPAVRANEEKNIFPLMGKTDFVINSMLPYEIFLISSYYRKVTEGYPADGFMSDAVYGLREKLCCTAGSAVTVSMIPLDSVFREFIV